MATFDGWEEQLYGHRLPNRPDTLCHFRTKGSKNGVRRYQLEDGTWTPLGLKERKAREGWGEQRRAARAERKAARAEKKATATAERNARIEALKEKRRQNDISKLSDTELQKKLDRVKMEMDYKEMTKSPILKTGERIVKFVLDYKVRKTEAEAELQKAVLENNRVRADMVRSREMTKKAASDARAAKYNADKAKQEAKEKEWDVRGGLNYERKAALKNAKTNYRGTTIWGAIGKNLNNLTKYRQEVRMNPLEMAKHRRAVEMGKIALQRDWAKAFAAANGGSNSDEKKKKDKKK